jgi:ABC-2 type transport system ATP-binding protein
VSAAPAAATGLAIEAHGLTKRFGDVLALDRLDLAVPAGSVFGFLGPNGGSKVVWALVIIFINLIGPILYFLVGREEA